MKKYLIYNKEYETEWIRVTKDHPVPINGFTDLESFLRRVNLLSEKHTFSEWKYWQEKEFKDYSSIVLNAALSFKKDATLLLAIDKTSFEVFAYKEVPLPRLDDFPMVERSIRITKGKHLNL